MVKSLFITIEGIDGSGKSTQISFIKDYFEQKGYEVILTREPGGTKIGEQIRDIILDSDNSQMHKITETLLYAASRAQHVQEVIKPALNSGKIVISDRFLDSSYAYQGYGRDLNDCVDKSNLYAVDGCEPDITFLLRVDLNVSKDRIQSREHDRLESEKIDFYNKVKNGYEILEKKYKNRIVGIDASKGIKEVSENIKYKLDEILG